MKDGFIVLYLILLVVGFAAVILALGLQETTFNRQRIGGTGVIFGDTLTIDDYNASYKYYILSNGLIYEYK